MVEVIAELGVIAIFALLGGVLATRLRQPPVLGLLLAGAVIGPHALGLVTQTDLVNSLAELGAALLLFMIGMEFSMGKLIKVGMRAFAIATFKVAFVFVVAYEAALLMGMPLFEALLLGAMLSITSTAIVAKILAGTGMKRKLEAKLLIAALIIEDIFAVFLLTFFSSLHLGGAVGYDLLLPFITAISVLALIYVVLEKGLRVFLEFVLRYRTDETLALTALAMAVGLSYAADLVGLAPSIGAFVAGSMVATLPGGHAIERSTKTFGAVFAALFFVSMGMLISPASVAANLNLILIFAALSIAAKFFGMSLGTYLAGMRGKTAVFCGLAMVSTGEFSLLLAREAQGLVQFDVIGVVATIVFLSTLATSAFVGSSEAIRGALASAMPLGFRLRLHLLSKYFGSVIARFEPGGQFFRTFLREGRRLIANAAVVAFVLGGTILLMPQVGGVAEVAGIDLPFSYVLLVVALAIVAYPLAYALDALKDILDELTTSFLRAKGRHDKLDMEIMRNLLLMAGMILLAAYMPLILSVLKLEGAWAVSLIPLFLAFMLLWEISKDVHEIFDLNNGEKSSGKIGEFMDRRRLPFLKFEGLRRIGRKKGEK